MLSECGDDKNYINASSSKDEFFSAESLFIILIFQQQKMINGLIAKVSEHKKFHNHPSWFLLIQYF
jgi:hypothetical protein